MRCYGRLVSPSVDVRLEAKGHLGGWGGLVCLIGPHVGDGAHLGR